MELVLTTNSISLLDNVEMIKASKGGKKRTRPTAVAAEAVPVMPGAVAELMKLARAGNRSGCAQLIPSLTREEINFKIRGAGPGNDESTLLIMACQQQDIEMSKLLLNHGADAQIKNKGGMSALTIACKMGNAELVRALRMHLSDSVCAEALCGAIGSTSDDAAALGIVSALLGNADRKKAAAVDHEDSDTVSSPLHAAAAAGFPRTLDLLIMHDDAHKLTSFDDKGNSPLQVAELLYQKYTLSRYLSGDFRRYVVRNGKVSIRHRRAELTDDSTASDADPTELREVDAEWEAVEERLIQDGLYADPEDNSAGDSDSSGPRVRRHANRNQRHRKKPNFSDTGNADKLTRMRDCILLLVKAMGFKTALYSDYALNTTTGFKLVISECGIPALLNELARNFKMTPWGYVATTRASDGTRSTIPCSTSGCPMCPSKGHEMHVSTAIPDRYAVVSWQCNACGVRGKQKSPRWFCESCHDDFCFTCVPRHAMSEFPCGESVSVDHGISFLESITELQGTQVKSDPQMSTEADRRSKASTSAKEGKPMSSLERDMKKRNPKIKGDRDQRIGDLPEEEKFLSGPDIGFENSDDTDLFIEAMNTIAELFTAAGSNIRGSRQRSLDVALWTAATNPEHSLRLLQERTIRAIMWCIFDKSSDIMDGKVLVEWATILQQFTNDEIEEHVLPAHCYVNLGVNSTVATMVPTDPIKQEPLSCKLVLDINRDPLYTLCHPSVTSELLMRITEMGFTIAYGLSGQNWDEEDNDHDADALMRRDLNLFMGYLEILLKVIVPRVFPIFEAVRTIEKEADSRTRRGSGKRDKRNRKGRTISLLQEIADALYPDLSLLFGTLETSLSLISGELMEDQADRVCSLLGGVYVWEMLCAVTTFDAAAIDRYLSHASHAPLLNYMSNASAPVNRSMERSTQKANGGRRDANNLDSKKRMSGVRDFDGAWLGKDWRFYIDALSYHTKSSRKIDMHHTMNYHPLIRIPIEPLDGPRIALRPTAEEVTELLLKATAGDALLEPSKPLKNVKNGNNRRNRGGNYRRRNNNPNELRSVVNMTRYLLTLTTSNHPLPLPIPRKLVELLKFKGDGIRWLVGGYTQCLTDALKFLMRFPWVLQDDQVLQYVNDCLYALSQSGEDISTIVLNRFTDPSVWVESIVQQLSVYDRSLHKKELGIEYDDEPGTGPGPMKEFFELTRIMFDLKPLTKRSLRDMVVGRNKPESTPSKKKGAAEILSVDTPFKSTEQETMIYEATCAVHVAMSDLLPLFQPAGDCNPTSILPVSIDAICERFPLMLTKNLKLSDTIEAGDLKADAVSDETKNRRARKELRGRGEIKDNKMCEAERALRKKITGIFEAIGVLLGHSIRNECPMGISLPVIVWAMLLGDKAKSFNWIDLCGDDKQLLHSCATILDETNVEDLQINFESTICSYLITKVSEIGQGLVTAVSNEEGADESPPPPVLTRASSSISGGMSINMMKKNIELIPGGSEMLVTNLNKAQFVQLYAETAYINKCEDSIAAIRRGLLKVIPDEYLSLLSPVYIMKQVRGEDNISIDALRASVTYEGGFSANHRVIRMFWHLVENEFSADDIRQLLLFWTGNSVAPSDGFRSDMDEDSRMCIRKMEQYEDRSNMKAKLPEASTCDKHLYLPVYETVTAMRTAVRAAIEYSCLGYDRL